MAMHTRPQVDAERKLLKCASFAKLTRQPTSGATIIRLADATTRLGLSYFTTRKGGAK